ncbi:hypothetical protein [Haloarcula sp. Atlit-120R]|uniref:hypothetical protein n=1 Tax=Haloarcula sp. Atlit-120R TaxID=2282135 RepID=UPI000EF1C0D4|nr:hypothetical protein [Haloarcula sp. Atlit-120R]RLM32640.1 hypothetical protein DVK01_20420 [Haloarcula sp. Atlit-120R]
MTVSGTAADGVVTLQDDDNDDAWIRAEYRDGWVGRKLMRDDGDAYADMVHPFYFRCRCCREYRTTERWGAGSPYCPGCEQRWHCIGDWLEATEDGELPEPTTCPECGSVDVELEILVPSTCNDCGTEFSREGLTA